MTKGLKITLSLMGLGIAAVVVYLVFLVKGSADHLLLVPKNSAFVGAVNFKNLASKLDMGQLKNLKMWKQFEEKMKKGETKEDHKMMKDFMSDPKFSGIDPFSNLYYFVLPSSEDEFAGGAVAHLLSSGSFEDFLKGTKIKYPIEEMGTFKQVKIESNAIVAWNEKSALFYFSSAEDTLKLLKDCAKMMNQKKGESILAVPEFNALNKSTYDLAGFLNYEGFSSYFEKAMSSNSLAGMNTMKGMKGSYTTATLNFEDNRVVCQVDNLVKDKTAFEKINWFKAKGLSAGHMKTITPDKIYSVMSLSFDVKKLLNNYNAMPGFTEMHSEARTKFSLTDEEIDNVLGGDFSMALVDFSALMPSAKENTVSEEKTSGENTSAGGPNAEEESGMYPPEEADAMMPGLPGFTVSLSINDKKAMEKIMNGLGLQKSPAGYYSVPAFYVNLFIVETSSGLTLTNNKTIADQLQTKKSLHELSDPVKSYVSEYPHCFFLDLDLDHYPKELLDQLKMMMGDKDFGKFSGTMKNFVALVSKGNAYAITSELNLSKGEGNSLMRLIQVMDQVNLR